MILMHIRGVTKKKNEKEGMIDLEKRNNADKKRNHKKAIAKPKGNGMVKKLAALVLCAAAGAVGSAVYNYSTGAGSLVINTVSRGDAIASSGSKTDSTAVAKKISASVVAITTENVQTSQSWFGSQVSSGAGSGVIISKNGYIVTCAHVVSDATKIGVTTSDNKKYVATLVGQDTASDVALLKISASGLTPATVADSDSIQQGQKVFAVGNPEGTFANSITSGIISAKSRKISVTVSGNDDESSFYGSQSNQTTMNVIQTDASVSPGNSGGGLFDETGCLIGIVNAKSAGSNTEGLGFAIPEKTVMKKISSIMKNKRSGGSQNSVNGQDQVQMP